MSFKHLKIKLGHFSTLLFVFKKVIIKCHKSTKMPPFILNSYRLFYFWFKNWCIFTKFPPQLSAPKNLIECWSDVLSKCFPQLQYPHGTSATLSNNGRSISLQNYIAKNYLYSTILLKKWEVKFIVNRKKRKNPASQSWKG